MSTEAEETTEEVVDTEQASVERFADKIAEINAQVPAEEADAEPEAEEVPTEEVVAEPVKVEGPTLAMKLFAKQHGLSEKVIAVAKSDEQLNDLVEEFVTTSRAAVRQPEPTPEPEFAITLPEDEFPEDDPVRKQLEAVKDYYDGKVKELEGYIGQMADIVLKTEGSIKAQEDTQVLTEQQEFDAFVDALEVPSLGNRAEAKITSIGQKLRQSLYWEMKDLETENPEASRQQLMERVAREAGFLSPQKKREEAVKSDNARRLGGGPTKPLPEAKLTGFDRFAAKVAEINARNK